MMLRRLDVAVPRRATLQAYAQVSTWQRRLKAPEVITVRETIAVREDGQAGPVTVVSAGLVPENGYRVTVIGDRIQAEVIPCPGWNQGRHIQNFVRARAQADQTGDN